MKGAIPVAPDVTLGHEAVGVVHALGSAVDGLSEGERVAVGGMTPASSEGVRHGQHGARMLQEIGFDDAFQYEDFAKPPEERSITLEQLHPELGATSYEAWTNKPK